MKRDMELMRKILLAIEEQYKPGQGLIHNLKVEEYDEVEVAEHCKLLYQEVLIDKYKFLGGDNTIIVFAVGNLTNKGYDFLNIFRNEEIWNKTKAEVKKSKLPETIELFGKVAGAVMGEMAGEFLKTLAKP